LNEHVPLGSKLNGAITV